MKCRFSVTRPRLICGLLVSGIILYLHRYYGILDWDQSRCNISDEKRHNIRFLINTVTPVMEKYNLTYWLDFGTALGAYRYCDVIPYDYDGDIGYLATEYDRLQQSLEEIRQIPGFSVSPHVTDIHYKNARLDVRGFRKVRKWSLSALYHQYKGESDNPSDFYLYIILENRWPIQVLIKNIWSESIDYTFFLKRKKVKFGDSCAYVSHDLEGYIKTRYMLTYWFELHTKQRCLKLFNKAPICHLNTCD